MEQQGISQRWIEIKKVFTSDEELASVLKLSATEVVLMNSRNFEGLSEFVENVYSVILYVKSSDAPNQKKTYRLLSQVDYNKDFLFPNSNISDDGIKTILSHEFDMTDGSKLSIPEECRKETLSLYSGRLGETLEALVLKLYETNHLSEEASASDKMNRIIAEEIFGQAVKVGEVFSHDGIMNTEFSRLGLVSIDKKESLNSDNDLQWYPLKNYTENIEYTYELIIKLAEMNIQIRLSNKALGNQYWWCYLDGETDIVSQSSTIMEAVCEATVKWIEKKKFINSVNHGINDANKGKLLTTKELKSKLKQKPSPK